jgi:hypothetical protein
MDLVDGIPQNDTLKVIKEGHFWAIVDFDFYQNDLFVLETEPGGVPFGGKLSRVSFDSNEKITLDIITENLYQPVRLIVHEDTLFVSNNTFNKGMDKCHGEILRAALR